MNFTFEFTEQEINIVLTALGELPAKASLGLINDIKSKAQAQIDAQGYIEETIESDD
jgi:hypothetical protein